jgi:hypothetical protein
LQYNKDFSAINYKVHVCILHASDAHSGGGDEDALQKQEYDNAEEYDHDY